MFEIVNRPRRSPMRDIMSLISEDPFFQVGPMQVLADEGTLPLDLIEGENEVIVRASMPGFRKSEIELHIENGVLSIKGRREEEKEEKGEKYYRRERRVGSVSRRVALPGIVADDKADAKLENGELTIRIPRTDASQPRQISVK